METWKLPGMVYNDFFVVVQSCVSQEVYTNVFKIQPILFQDTTGNRLCYSDSFILQ